MSGWGIKSWRFKDPRSPRWLAQQHERRIGDSSEQDGLSMDFFAGRATATVAPCTTPGVAWPDVGFFCFGHLSLKCNEVSEDILAELSGFFYLIHWFNIHVTCIAVTFHFGSSCLSYGTTHCDLHLLACRLDTVHEEHLKDCMECLCVPLSEHKKRCDVLLRILKAKKGIWKHREFLCACFGWYL